MHTGKVSLLLMVIAVSGVCFGGDIYVAKTGLDTNPGTLESPYLTISKAATVAVAGDVVYIRDGIYEETLTPANSGTSGNPIIFQSYPGEEVTITAMQALSGWTLDSGSVYKKTNITWDLGQKNCVMNDGTACDLARWPNNTDGDPWTQNSLRNTGGSDGSVITNAYLDYAPGIPDIDWENGGSLYFYGDSPGAGWLTWRRFIKSRTSTRVTFDLETAAGVEWIRTVHAPADLGDFWLQGVKGALDYQNEWYFDASVNTLYIQIPGGGAPADGQISMRRRELTIDLGSKNYIEVRNLKVYGGEIEISGSNNKLYGVTSLYGNWHLGVVTGFNAGSQSVYVGGSNNTIENCEIGYGSGTGIWDFGSDNLITNSYIHDFDYLGDYDAIVVARSGAGGNGTRLIGNTITRAGRDALQLVTTNCEIAYNDISYSSLIADDCGLFYNTGGPKNTVIHHNWFHDAYSSGTKTKAAGIYLDNDSEGFSVHHNVVWNTEWSNIQMNLDCKDIDVFNNTFWDGSAVMGAWHAPGTSFTNVRVWNNLGDNDNWEPQSDLQNNLTMTSNPFIDSAIGDFRLNAATTPIDYGRVIAGITDGYVGTAPDAGAYEYGDDDWVAGVVGLPYGGLPRTIPGRIEAEEYNLGNQRVAYYDTTAGNAGGLFRTDDVDIEARDGGYTVGWVTDGEWLAYTVNAASGLYDLTARVASIYSSESFTIWLDGVQVTTVNVPNTGDWATFETVTIPTITVPDANDVLLRIEFSCPSGGLNINWIEFAGETVPPTPDPATWQSPDGAPKADGSTRISMTATTGSDVSEPVEYNFEETSGNPGGSDSGWQTSASYTDSDLDPEIEYTYRVQMRDALGNMTGWSSSASATTLPYLGSDGPFLEVGGEVCFEAEHYDGLEARLDSPDTWTEDTAKSGAVGSYMWTVDGQFTPNFGAYSDATRLLYELKFTTVGDYTVYVRRQWDSNQIANSGSNSVWAGLDGTNTGAVDNSQDPDQWIWKSLGTVNIASAGTRTLDIVRREDGYMIDRVVVTQGAAPSGTGPAESVLDFSTTMVEYAIFAGYWQRTDCTIFNDDCSGADIDKDGDVVLDDLMMFAERWLN